MVIVLCRFFPFSQTFLRLLFVKELLFLTEPVDPVLVVLAIVEIVVPSLGKSFAGTFLDLLNILYMFVANPGRGYMVVQ